MKKFNLLLLLALLFVPFLVKADMGAPEMLKYDVLVVKEEGIDRYTYDYKKMKYVVDGHIDKGTKITIEMEIKEGSTTYLYYRDNSAYESYYVKSTDVVLAQEELSYKDSSVDKLDKEINIIINSDDVKVKKGPSEVYETVGILEKGTKGSYKYHIENSVYIYVEMQGLKGWISIEDGGVLMQTSDMIVAEPIKLTCGTIPTNTVLEDVYVTDSWTGKTLIEYKGCKELWSSFKTPNLVPIVDDDTYAKVSEDLKLYEDPKGKSVGVVKKGETVKIESDTYYGRTPYYTEDVNGEGTLFVYVLYEGKGYWAEYTNDYEVVFEKTAAPKNASKEDKKDKKEEKKKQRDDDDEDDEEGLDSTTIIIICVIAAVAFSLGALVTIILVNKRKKSKVTIKED